MIIIKIGLQRGIVSQEMFAPLLIMAVITTLMASPIFDRIAGTGGEIPRSEPEENHANADARLEHAR